MGLSGFILLNVQNRLFSRRETHVGEVRRASIPKVMDTEIPVRLTPIEKDCARSLTAISSSVSRILVAQDSNLPTMVFLTRTPFLLYNLVVYG